jgi:hypothetical protein
MPEVQEVFRMSTQKVRPDPGALERQHGAQRQRTMRRKLGAYGLVAALAIAIVIVAVQVGGSSRDQTPLGEPSGSGTTTDVTAPDGTVTFDGSTCSLEMTTGRIKPGVLQFDVVNNGDQRVMLDSWQILDGFTFPEFQAAVQRVGRLAEAGRPYPDPGFFPDQQTEIRYLRSDIIPAHGSGSVVTTFSAGTNAITCLRRFEGADRSLRGLQPFDIVGPIVVG